MNKKIFYTVYKITNLINEHIYIGVHKTDNPMDKYYGSSKYLNRDIKKLGKNNFKKEILFVYDNKEEMLAKEKELVNREFCYRNDTYNKVEGGGTYVITGKLTVKDNENNTFMIYNDDPRYLSGDLISIWKDKNHSKETKKKIGEKSAIHQKGRRNSNYGMRWMNNGIDNKKVKKENIKKYLNNSWIKGKSIYNSVWSDEQINYLIKNYENYGPAYCSEYLNISLNSCKTLAKKLKLKMINPIMNKKIRPSIEELLINVKNLGYKKTARIYDVSIVSIFRWVKDLKKLN